MTERIQHALTPDQWTHFQSQEGQEALANGFGLEVDVCSLLGDDVRGCGYGAGPQWEAAVLLYNQPFGFTKADADAAREAATYWVVGGIGYDTSPFRNQLLDLADRIDALLPPSND